jgi:uncharacterized protein (TIGR01777 family)
MKVLITGSSGLIGSALLRSLPAPDHQVIRLLRGSPKEGEVHWNPEEGFIERDRLHGIDAAVHLAGESIANGRWTPAKKARILNSRVKGTQLLAETLATLAPKPKVLLSASAVGFYGSRGAESLNETSRSGEGFLAEVARQCEAATSPAAAAGIRVVNLRFGIVLSPVGGILKRMLPPFKMGLGGVIGNGRQFISWVAINDVVGAIHHLLMDESIRGPVNVATPHPVTSYQFTKTLGSVLRRPTIVRMPALVARLLFGEMADELLLASARAEPKKLVASGYQFLHPHLEEALRHLLGR